MRFGFPVLSFRSWSYSVYLLPCMLFLYCFVLPVTCPLWTRVGSRKMTDRVTTSPVRLCSRDGKICYYRRLEYTVSCFCVFLLSFFCSVHIRISVCFSWSSVQQSAPRQQVRVYLKVLFHLCSALQELGIPDFFFFHLFYIFRISCYSWQACFLCSPIRYVR